MEEIRGREKEKEDLISKLILVINPDNSNAWSKRKSFLSNTKHPSLPNIKDLLSSELNLLNILLNSKKGSKSPLVWYHRKWILERFYLPELSPSNLFAFYSNETRICDSANKLHPRNYYSSKHRLWLISTCLQLDHSPLKLFLLSLPSPSNLPPTNIYHAEVSFTRQWISSNPSDSGIHNHLYFLYNSFLSIFPDLSNGLLILVLQDLDINKNQISIFDNSLYPLFQFRWLLMSILPHITSKTHFNNMLSLEVDWLSNYSPQTSINKRYLEWINMSLTHSTN
ncbi:hypothetical protein BB559_000181 [Furculomyces boomerangus]|uniref:Uncharacterized protein n=3 Tax=Harpellales TaxID=61421 RepID=A0A2T9Z635_9FUNG|nr:hypothetical protein BB559_007107 [Furculomyces boomerangus]PVV00030.1 hypothetical protein BB559_000181 [Furculomyces boomerangus]PWA01824.1 hypothetical protein BB558_002065 [Smittium angustum]